MTAVLLPPTDQTALFKSKPNPTVYVQNIPASATSEQLQDHFSQFGPVRQCFVVQDPSKPNRNRGFGFVHFAIPEDAKSAIEKAAAVRFLNLSNLSVQPAKPRQSLDDRHSKKRSHTATANDSHVPLPNPKKPKITSSTTARLIVRNLSFKCSPAVLKKVFSEYGTVSETTMPRKYLPDGPYKGFGIVQFSKRSDAEKALHAMNEKTICDRIVAVDWCLPQAQFLIGEGMDAEKVERELTEKFVSKRKMKEELDAAKDTGEPTVEVQVDTGPVANHELLAGEQVKEADVSYSQDVSSVSSESDAESDSSVQKRKNAPKFKKFSAMPSIGEGTTVFVRNVPFEVTEEELSALFETFGPLVYVKITCDRETKRSKGTAFACYESRSSADMCLAEGAKTNNLAYAMTTTSSTSLQEPAPMVSTLLTPDVPEALLGSTLVIHGRVLNVTRAVDREQAGTLTAKELQRRMRKDNRRMYLLEEGYQGKEVSERRKSMETNGALYVSDTRIAFRNVPLTVNEKELKAFAVASARMYLDTVVSKGLDLAWPELGEEDVQIGDRDFVADAGQVRPTVKQVKIVRSKDRLDPATGNFRSKGFGFVEFYDHLGALACVRCLADPTLDRAVVLTQKCLVPDEGQQRVPEVMVEFALENKQVVNLRAAKISRVQQQQRVPVTSRGGQDRTSRGSSGRGGSTMGRGGSAGRGGGRSTMGRGGNAGRGRGGGRGGGSNSRGVARVRGGKGSGSSSGGGSRGKLTIFS